MGFASGAFWGRRGAGPTTKAEAKVTQYHCPMHPTYVSDRPGECPICGMDLVPLEEETTISPGEKTARYHCPMHPTYVSDRPGECPICGMDLVPLEEAAEAPASTVEGLAVVKITPEKQQLIGVRTERVKYLTLDKTIRTVGMVEVDETKLTDVNTKIDGWIEELYVDYTGQLVKKGQPLLAIYSPELVATQEEYLLALRARKQLQDSPFPDIARSGDSLVEAARRRLELWDIPASEIKAIERSGEPIKTLLLFAPFTGYVMERRATEGMYVRAGMPLYRLADLSTVWVQADIYEYELPLVKVGQHARLTVNAYPGRTFPGRVTYVYPTVEGRTRTVKVRFEFLNPQELLKPGLYANVEIRVPLGRELAVPAEAVLDSGLRQIVFVAQGEGYFEPREVKLGSRAGDYYLVLSGLEEGEEVVSSGNFLIDAESRLKAAISGMGAPSEQEVPSGEGGEAAAGGHAGHGM